MAQCCIEQRKGTRSALVVDLQIPCREWRYVHPMILPARLIGTRFHASSAFTTSLPRVRIQSDDNRLAIDGCRRDDVAAGNGDDQRPARH